MALNKSFRIEKATSNDDEEIRILLRETPMEGHVKLSFEQDPNYFEAQNIEGDRHITLLVKENDTNSIIGMGSRSIKRVYINGKIHRIGYLSKLRARSGKRAIQCLIEGFSEFKKIRQTDELSFDMTSIIDDNLVARNLLEKGHSKLPSYKFLTNYSTYLIPTKKKMKKQASINSDQVSDLKEIARCLQRNNSRYQFATNWTEEDLSDNNLCRELKPNDFILLKKNNKVTACAAIWDQRKFKQSIVKEYKHSIGILKPIINIALSLFRYPSMPAPNSVIPMAFLSHIAVDEDNEDDFKLLLDHAIKKAMYKGIEFLVVGFADNHPLRRVVQDDYSIREYLSRIYLVGNKDSLTLENSPIHIEVATL